MTVEHPKAPCRHDQKTGAGKQNSNQGNRCLPLLAFESRGDDIDEQRGDQDTTYDQRRSDQGKQTEDGARDTASLLSLLSAEQSSVDRYEGGGEYALPKEILQKVGDLERGIESVRRI
jgi:hypothetical protein